MLSLRSVHWSGAAGSTAGATDAGCRPGTIDEPPGAVGLWLWGRFRHFEQAGSGGTLRLLMIDEDMPLARLTFLDFRRSGLDVSVDWASDGEEGLRRLRGEGEYAGLPIPDAVIIDSFLHGMECRELVRSIRADPSLAGIRLILASDNGPDCLYGEKKDITVDAVVPRPATALAILSALGRN